MKHSEIFLYFDSESDGAYYERYNKAKTALLNGNQKLAGNLFRKLITEVRSKFSNCFNLLLPASPGCKDILSESSALKRLCLEYIDLSVNYLAAQGDLTQETETIQTTEALIIALDEIKPHLSTKQKQKLHEFQSSHYIAQAVSHYNKSLELTEQANSNPTVEQKIGLLQKAVIELKASADFYRKGKKHDEELEILNQLAIVRENLADDFFDLSKETTHPENLSYLASSVKN